jgi:hypothetical protein
MVAKRHKITNVPLFKKLWDIIFFFWDQKVIVPQKENYVPQFLKQRDINSYFIDWRDSVSHVGIFDRICLILPL